MPFSIRMATVIYYTRLIAYRSLPFVTTAGTGGRSTNNDIAASMWQLDINADPGLTQHPQIATCVIVLLAASLVFAVSPRCSFPDASSTSRRRRRRDRCRKTAGLDWRMWKNLTDSWKVSRTY